MRIMTNGYTGKNLELEQMTGFHNPNPSIPILILDERGIPFYDTSQLANQPSRFNLPAGRYIVMSGKFYRMAPVEYPLLPIATPHRYKRKNPERFEIVFTENPAHKCTIDWDTEKIYFDNSFRDMPLPNLVYVLYHEYGHRYYGCNCLKKSGCKKCAEAELQCDRYAQNRMLETGYNPSQIGEAIIGTLSSKQFPRKKAVVDSTLEVSDFVYCPANQNYFSGDSCDGMDCNCGSDSLEYTDTPSPDWSCEDWVAWHKDLLAAYQDGRLASYDYEKALTETNRVFAYHWKESAGFSKQFWGSCGYRSGFYNYFRSVGYTDHISFLAALFSGAGDTVSEIAGGAADVAKQTAQATTGTLGTVRKFLPLLLLAVGVILVIALKTKVS